MFQPMTQLQADIPDDAAENPFATETGTGTDPFLTAGQQVASIILGVAITGLSASIGLICLWNGFQLYAQFYLNPDPAEALLTQLGVVELATLIVLGAAIAGISTLLGWGAATNMQRQLRRNMQQRKDRAELETRVAEMHRAVMANRQNPDSN